MTGYDVDVHKYQRYENFFNGLETGNVDMFNMSYENIKKLESEDFNSKIDVLEHKLEVDIKSIEKSTLELIQDNDKSKNLNDVMNHLNLAKEQSEARNNRFINEIRVFMIKWMKEQQTLKE